MKVTCLYMCLLIVYINVSDAARILGVFPSSSISHQAVFRALTQELARRGHEVVVITANPAFPAGKTPANFTEIDVSRPSKAIKKQVVESAKGNNADIFTQVSLFVKLFSVVVDAQLNTTEVQTLLADKNQHFDLLLIEACFKSALVFSHFYKAPVILISSFGAMDQFLDWTGAVIHPILYPTTIHQRLYGLTLLEKIKEVTKHYIFEYLIRTQESHDDKMLTERFGETIPPLKTLKKNVDMIFLDVYRLWDNNRPVPPNVIYLGGLHMSNRQEAKLDKSLESNLKNSKHGVIYMSLGTNASPSTLSQDKIHTLLNAFAKVRYDVLFKWEAGELDGLPANVQIFKWFPQVELLKNQNVKLFITQGGLQSTCEAIMAGVPMIGMPMLGDQWYNVEQFERHGIGLRLEMQTLNEDKLINAIESVINNASYRANLIRLRDQLLDEPQTSLERAVWWAEHIMRRKGGRHLHASGVHTSWVEYYELELVAVLLAGITLVVGIFVTVVSIAIVSVKNVFGARRKLKQG